MSWEDRPFSDAPNPQTPHPEGPIPPTPRVVRSREVLGAPLLYQTDGPAPVRGRLWLLAWGDGGRGGPLVAWVGYEPANGAGRFPTLVEIADAAAQLEPGGAVLNLPPMIAGGELGDSDAGVWMQQSGAVSGTPAALRIQLMGPRGPGGRRPT